MTFQMILGLMIGVCVAVMSYLMGINHEKKRQIKKLKELSDFLDSRHK